MHGNIRELKFEARGQVDGPGGIVEHVRMTTNSFKIKPFTACRKRKGGGMFPRLWIKQAIN
jgi:hypothetical protein